MDFIVETDNSIIPIEVKLHANVNTVGKGLRSFIELYKPKQTYVISYKQCMGEVRIGECIVYFRDFSHMGLLKKL